MEILRDRIWPGFVVMVLLLSATGYVFTMVWALEEQRVRAAELAQQLRAVNQRVAELIEKCAP